MTTTEETPENQLIELTRHVLSSILPEDANIELKARDKRGVMTVSVRVDEQYRGIVIGSRGSTVRALRQVANAADFGDAFAKIDIDIADD